MQLNIDPEFKNLLAPLTKDEYSELEKDILENGCEDTIKVWNGIIVDGHNRYSICLKHGLIFDTQEKEFDSRDQVKNWMIRHQLARRNQTPEQISYFRGKLYEQEKKSEGGRSDRSFGVDIMSTPKTAERIANEYGVDEKTIRRDADFAKAIDTIGKQVGEDVKHQILSGELPVTKKDVVKLAQMPEEKRKAITEKITTGGTMADAMTLQQAIKEVKIREREAKIEEQREAIASGKAELPEGVFEVIAIDPPWNYGRTYDPDGSRIANPYPEMTQDQLLDINLPAADDAVIFLWTTHAFLWDAKELLDHWGFTYKATLVWDKQQMGMGAWLRMQCEFCLVGIKGKPIWSNTTWRDIIAEPRRQHSRKPEAFYQLVESVTVGRRLEYFSREAREGWEVFGDEC